MATLTKQKHSLDYRGDIDGMRALSITLVAMYHINVAYMPTGKVGVDVFFVISGYLITSILLKEHVKGTYSLKQFYVRRVKRIFPVLFISLAVFLMVIFFFFNDATRYISQHVIGSILMAMNFWRIKNQYYPQNQFQKYNFVIPNWTLAIEEQFYLLWPLALAYIFKKQAKKKFIIVGLLTLLSYILMILLEILIPSYRLASYIPFCRSWELSAGCLLAISQYEKAKIKSEEQLKLNQNFNQEQKTQQNQDKIQKDQQQPYWNEDGSISSVIATVCIIVYGLIPSYTGNPGFQLPLIIGCAVLIIINKKSLFNRKILGSKPMRFIGKISYSFYIWHQGIIMLFDLNKYISIGVAVIAVLVYQVEDRIRISKHPLTVPFILGFGSILLIVAFIILFS